MTDQTKELAWIGSIPSHWQVRRLGYHFTERRDKVSDKDFAPLSVTMKGVVPQLENVAKTDDGDNRKRVCAGDFVINSRSDRRGSAGVASIDGSVSLINTVLRPRPTVDIKFAAYLLTSYPFQEEFYRVGHGIVADMWTTKYSEMKNIWIALPSYSIQNAIADYLDRATARIDCLVAKKTRFIELLREKRQALITHAVTRGLNAEVPMKDSGIDWMGRIIPASWEVRRLKALLREETKDIGGDAPAGAISFGDVVFKDFDNEETLATYRAVLPGQFLINPLNLNYDLKSLRIALSTIHCRVSPAYIVASHKVASADARFLRWALRVFDVQHIKTLGAGVRQTVKFEDIGACRIALPPLDQQVAIASHLDRATTRIDALISKTERSIELLKEHRTALITSAVAGEIDLREAA
jgi:type I restriction enzyme S subunit